MASSMEGFEHLEIQLEEIKSATNNFNEENVIGHGGFGKVYKGELSHSHSEGKSMVALKRLDRKHGQGDAEFYKEVRMLSCYRHENIISLLGFSRGRDEMILVYEYASRGSLDRYLKDVNLTWTQRLKICLDAAKGLSYLHDPRETYQRLIHCDIKSANILLDENFKAKVSDFGLSKIGPANQQNSILVTGALGTFGYCDPLFMETYSLTKESDVYSFGVVLFEVLSGRLCFEFSNGQLKIIVPMWKQSYEENKLDEIILHDLIQQMDPSSLHTFTNIAYQCLQKAREERPTMARVVEELEIALESQEFPDLRLEVLTKYEDLLMAADPLLIYKTGKQLKEILSKGLTINEGKTWLSITENGECIERIHIEACLNPDEIKDDSLQHPPDDMHETCLNLHRTPIPFVWNMEFPGGLCYSYRSEFKARVRAEYLTPQILYTVNIVLRYKDKHEFRLNKYSRLRYKIDGEDETKVFIIYPSTHLRKHGWFIVPFYHFTSQHSTADLQFVFEQRFVNLLVAGFEFQPSEEKVQLPVFEEYQHIVEAASQSLFYTSLYELKKILSIGVHLNGYKTWFSLNEKGKHSHMISMEDCLIPNEDFPPRYESHQYSRFPAGLYQTNNKGFKTHVKTLFLSPSITYTVNLVYNGSSNDEQAYVDLKYRLRGEATTFVVYLANRRKDDGLHMAELYQFTSDGSIVDLEIIFDDSGTNIRGVEGIMFQPLEIVKDQVSKDKVENIESVSDSESDTFWEQKLPNDYEEILNLSKDSLQWTTKKELYSILRRGFLIDNGQQWFTVDKHGKKCPMLSARANWVIDDRNSACESSHESRFGEVIVITDGDEFEIKGEIRSEVVSPGPRYAAYLVYKLPQDQSTFEAPLCAKHKGFYSCYIYLGSPPHTPVIGPKFDENTYNPLNRYKGIAIPQQRTDGWMEVKVSGFYYSWTKTKTEPMDLIFKHPGKKDLKGLIVEGIELRPI